VETCPGKEESAEQNHSSRSAKGNKYLRRVLNQAAHAAVAKKGSHFQAVFRRLLPRLGYQSAIRAVAHRLGRLVWQILHEGVRLIEPGHEMGPQEKKKRAQMLARALRKLGYEVTIGKGKNFRVIFFDEDGGNHDSPPTVRREAYTWLASYL
jgi:transposase